MEFKYKIGFLIPKYGQIIDREMVGKNDIRYRVKMNYDDPESEVTEVFTEEVINYYVEKYLSENKNYTSMTLEEMEKFKEYENMMRNKKSIK